MAMLIRCSPPALGVVRASDDRVQAATLAWPPASPPFRVTAQRETRQPAYDPIVIHPDRGNDANGRPFIAAPMCGEFGVQLQLRHGLSAVHAPRVTGPLVGWGIGRGDQRVDRGSVNLGYAATCRAPRTDEWQVLLVHSLSVGFKYVPDQGLGIDGLASGKATGSADDTSIAALHQAYADKAHPAVLDSKLHALYPALFPNFRFYDSTVDADVPANVQQVPEVNRPPIALETS